MDATERPIKISKDFSIYAEKHKIYETFKRLLTSLVIKMPDDPLPFMIDFFQNLKEIPKILLLGARCSGKSTLAALLSEKFGCEVINWPDEKMEEADEEVETKSLEHYQSKYNSRREPNVRSEFKSMRSTNYLEGSSSANDASNEDGFAEESDGPPKASRKTILAEKWAAPLIVKLQELEAQRKGWVLDGNVKGKEQAMVLCSAGFFPTHTVILDAPSNVLVARAMRLIEEAGEDQENTFSDFSSGGFNPANQEDQKKLLANLVEEVEAFCHHRNILMESFKHSVKAFNSDQPVEDVFKSVSSFLCQPHRTVIPFTPRILILGPPGTPVEDAAIGLAEKYKINLISFEDAKENEITKNTKLGQIFTLCHETCSQDPDEAMFDLINQEVNNIEYQSRGWLVIGFPRNLDQTKFFAAAGHEPNRVFFLNMMNDQIMENYRSTLEEGVEDARMVRIFHKKGTLSKEELCLRLTNYRLNEAELKKFYEEEGFEIDATMSLENIIQTLEAILVNPLPSCNEVDVE